MREKVGKSRDTVFFPMFCGSGESKSRLAKAAGAEPSGQIAPHCGERFGKCLEVSVSKSARLCSTVWTTLRRWKSVRRCGAKHISKSKCARHHGSGAFLEVEMLQKCTELWRETHDEVEMLKILHARVTTDTTLGYTTLTTLHDSTQHYNTIHYITLH